MVEGAKEIIVILADKREFNAKVLGRDPKTDLAVLKIDATGDLPVAKLGDSAALQVGDWVMAIGNPFGLSNTVTAGIVSAKGRVIGAGPYDDFIQTDASINPGNSGGPLFNEQGEVVGINSAIFSQTGGNVGIGFAIPINLAKQLLPELETKGSVTRGWLGVAIQQVTPELAESLRTDGAHGALVADVTKDGPAEKAGVKRGDVIVTYDGKKIENSSSLPVLVAATPVGRTVPVDVLRNGKIKALDVTISKLSEKEVAVDEPTARQGKLGLALRDLRPEERERLRLKDDEGVGVESVMPDSPAAQAGIQAGDVILQVNQTAVGSAEEVKKAVHKAGDDKPLLFLLRRADGNNQFVTLAAK
jgi:serine protease Do